MNEQEAVEALNQGFDHSRVKATALSCRISGPLHHFTVQLGAGTSINKLENTKREVATFLRATSPAVILTNFKSGSVDYEMMFGQHPVVLWEEMAAKTRKEVPQPGPLPILLGAINIDQPLVRDLSKMPHLLVAGATGSGKSIQLHSIIKSLVDGVYSKPDVRLVLLDPKMVEFSRYKDLPALAYEIGTSPEDCAEILQMLDKRMRDRLKKLAEHGCNNIHDYHAKGLTKMPFLVVIIDELADLVRNKKIDFVAPLCSLTDKARAAGIYIIAATQHPSHQVVKGEIKANFTARIGLKVANQVHSQVVLDVGGAEDLAGMGDALIIDGELHLARFRGCWVDLESRPKPPEAPPKKSLLKRLLGKN